MGECHRRDERAPIALDASNPVWPIASADGIICINMVHISPWKATLGLLKGAAAILPTGSPLYLYGPYISEGFATAPSNQAFDQSLRDRDPNWGLRDLEAVAATAQALGFSGPVITEMPANNLSVVFRRMRSVSLHGRDRPGTVAFEIHTGRVAPLSACHGSPAAMTVCQKSAVRKATTIMRRIPSESARRRRSLIGWLSADEKHIPARAPA
jgi:hypothetical protein